MGSRSQFLTREYEHAIIPDCGLHPKKRQLGPSAFDARAGVAAFHHQHTALLDGLRHGGRHLGLAFPGLKGVERVRETAARAKQRLYLVGQIQKRLRVQNPNSCTITAAARRR